MSATNDLLDRLAEIGATVKRADNCLVLRAGPKPIPGELVQRLREAKAEVLATLAPAGHTSAAAVAFCRCSASESAWWRRHFIIRTIDRGLGGTRSHAEAARLAWGELQCRWHRLHGARSPEWQCAGCGELIGGLPALELADKARVHFETLNCLLRYGERWRLGASEALSTMGLSAPAGDDAT